jgi:hypothetical protein
MHSVVVNIMVTIQKNNKDVWIIVLNSNSNNSNRQNKNVKIDAVELN